jgi:hypothetical protein
VTDAERLAIDRVVCAGLRKQPGQSLAEAARYALRHCRGRRFRAAEALLAAGDPWDRMKRAAQILRGLELVR